MLQKESSSLHENPPPIHAHNKFNSKSLKRNFLYILGVLLFLICCFFCAKYSVIGLGETVEKSRKTLILTLFLTFLCASKSTYKFFVLPVALLVSLYSPVGFEYGPPDMQATLSFYATDMAESIEFVSMIPAKTYLKAILISLLPFIAYRIALLINLQPWKNKTYVLCMIGFLVILLKPTSFIDKSLDAIDASEKALTELNRYVSKSSWGASISSTQNKDYILVIGESARRDYFHIYGYPVENTPFLDNGPVTIVNGLTSGDTYTVGSLRLMLTHGNQEKWEPRYDLNLIDMAKSANIETTWISNQGLIGRHDTPIAAIGNRADQSFFPNKQAYNKKNFSDFLLLSIFDKQIIKETNRSRLFVLHTLGSHANACAKLEDFPDVYKVNDLKLRYVACYVSTIKKTDNFLEKLYTRMKKHEVESGRPFSILYVGDHGQAHREHNGQVVLVNNLKSKYHYDIPLILIESDSKEKRLLESKKSGLLFTAGLAHWMNIKNDLLPAYDLFDGKNDDRDFGLNEKIGAITTPKDPAIDIRNVLIQ